jgi:hypothetical protein
MNLQTTAPESAQQQNEPKKLYTISSCRGMGQGHLPPRRGRGEPPEMAATAASISEARGAREAGTYSHH